MDKEKEQSLKVAKEIVVKFIEVGRISPTNFQEFFPLIYNQVRATLREDPEAPLRVGPLDLSQEERDT